MLTRLGLICILLSGCQPKVSGGELLSRCWGAAPTGGHERYDVSLEAVVFKGIEGGVWSRSQKCPERRLSIDYTDEAFKSALDKAVDDETYKPGIATGIRVRAIVVVVGMPNENVIRVDIVDVKSWSVLPDREVSRLLRGLRA